MSYFIKNFWATFPRYEIDIEAGDTFLVQALLNSEEFDHANASLQEAAIQLG